MKSLYDLAEEFEILMEAEGEEEAQALAIVCQDIDTKAEGYSKFFLVLASEVDKLKAEEKRLAEIRKALEAKEQRAKDRLKAVMLEHNIMAMGPKGYGFALSPTAGTLEIEDPEKVPTRYRTIIPETFSIDKTKLKADIKAGTEVEGCEIKSGWSLRTK